MTEESEKAMTTCIKVLKATLISMFVSATLIATNLFVSSDIYRFATILVFILSLGIGVNISLHYYLIAIRDWDGRLWSPA